MNLIKHPLGVGLKGLFIQPNFQALFREEYLLKTESSFFLSDLIFDTNNPKRVRSPKA